MSVRDVTVAGRVETSQVPPRSQPGELAAEAARTYLDRLRITRLHVGSVQAQHLVYQDEDNRIEIGPPDVPQPKHMKGFQPLMLKNLDVWDLQWERRAGVSTGRANLEKYELSATYQDAKDLAAGLKVGIALVGGGMTAEVTGPGIFGADVGRIEKIRGTYRDEKIDTRFSTGEVGGSIVLGPDFVEARDISIKGFGLGQTTYKDPPRSLELKHVLFEDVKLGRVRQNFASQSDPEKHGEKALGTLEVEGLDFSGVSVGSFTYDGSSTAKTPDGRDKTSTQHVEGKHATIEHLKVGSIVHDPARSTEILGVSVDSGEKNPAVWSPFRVRGLAATLTSKIGGDKAATTKLITDVEGGPLTAEKITFATVKLGTTTGPDGKPRDVTRTSIDGGFNLTRLGFVNPDLTLTAADGKVTRLSTYEYGSIELKGIKPQFLPNGSVRLPIDSVAGRNLQLQVGEGGKLKPGDLTVKLPLVEIKDIVLGLKGQGTTKGLELLGAKIGSVSASKVEVDLTIDRSVDTSEAGYQRRLAAYREALTAPRHAFIAEPLSGMHGDAEIEVEHVDLVGPLNLPWDPNLTLPIRAGKINFDHVHPYAVNIRKGELTLGDFGPEKNLLDLPPDLQGVHGEAGEHGMLDLRELVEGLFSAPPTEPKRDASPADLSKLKDLNLGVPSLALGSGKIGFDLSDDKSLGPGDVYLELEPRAAGENVLTIPWQHVGERVELKMPHLHAKGAGIPRIGSIPGGSTKDIDVFNLYVRIEGLAELQFKLHVWVDSATIKDIQLGDLTLTNAADLAKLAAPGPKDVKPEGTP